MTTSTAPSTSKSSSCAGLLPWGIWGLGAAFYLYETFLKVSPNVMATDLMRTFHVTATPFGKLASMYFFVYAFMQLPVGVLLDRFGPRILLTLATAACVVGTFTFGFAPNLIIAGVGRLLIGFGAAFAVVSTMKLAANWFPMNRFALLVGLMVTAGFSGAIFAQYPLAILIQHTDWRSAMKLIGAIGVGLGLIIWFVVRDKPQDAIVNEDANQVEYKDMFTGISTVLASRQTWLAACFGVLMFTPTEVLGQVGDIFFTRVYDSGSAKLIISFIFFGWLVGSPLLGALSDHLGRRKVTMIYGNIGGLITITALIYVKMPFYVALTTAFIFGFSSSGFLAAFSIVREINIPAYNATALGFMNMFNESLPVFILPIIGITLDKLWDGKMVDGVPFYTINDYHMALFALPICMLLSLLILPFIKETHCKVTRA